MFLQVYSHYFINDVARVNITELIFSADISENASSFDGESLLLFKKKKKKL